MRRLQSKRPADEVLRGVDTKAVHRLLARDRVKFPPPLGPKAVETKVCTVTREVGLVCSEPFFRGNPSLPASQLDSESAYRKRETLLARLLLRLVASSVS